MTSPQQARFELDPPYDDPAYGSTSRRAPKQPLIELPADLRAKTGPMFAPGRFGPLDADLTRQHVAEPSGERIVITGRLLDDAGRPIPNQLIEIWQANAAGRYAHSADQHPAPLDANFTGAGRCLSGPDGSYRFVTIKPGAYPWKNHVNAWRPAHVHFSVFGRAFTERLVTQMYFPGDPLFAYDPIFQSVRDPAARVRMISSFDLGSTVADWALGYRFDVVVGGHLATPTET